MKHGAILFVVNKTMNDLMRQWDVFHPNKVLVTPQKMTFETKSEVNDEYFQRMIEETATAYDDILFEGIAAIKYGENWYFHPNVSCISDGEYEMFTPNPFGSYSETTTAMIKEER